MRARRLRWLPRTKSWGLLLAALTVSLLPLRGSAQEHPAPIGRESVVKEHRREEFRHALELTSPRREESPTGARATPPHRQEW